MHLDLYLGLCCRFHKCTPSSQGGTPLSPAHLSASTLKAWMLLGFNTVASPSFRNLCEAHFSADFCLLSAPDHRNHPSAWDPGRDCTDHASATTAAFYCELCCQPFLYFVDNVFYNLWAVLVWFAAVFGVYLSLYLHLWVCDASSTHGSHCHPFLKTYQA